jgi:O-antigen/teichoic acid export membrane protein
MAGLDGSGIRRRLIVATGSQPLERAEPSGEGERRNLTRLTARAASITGLRQAVSMGAGAVTTAVVARILGPTPYGYYVGGLAAFQLALAVCDIGFSLVASREMAQSPEGRADLLRSIVRVSFAWSCVVALGLVVVAFATGVGSRGEVMLALAPGVLMAGLSPARQIFYVTFDMGKLLVVDVVSSFVQAGAMIAVALLNLGIVAIALAACSMYCAVPLVCLWLAKQTVGAGRSTPALRRSLLRMAVPLGIASLIASLYFTIDQVILTWIVSPAQLAHYAAAVKLLTLTVTIPGFIMQAGLPTLARAKTDYDRLSDVTGRLTHWIAATAFPLCVGLLVFAKPAVNIVFGHEFLAAATLLRVLMVAGILSLASNVCGIVLSALAIVRPQLIFNLITLCVNVIGNIVLVPRYGVIASAWLTVGCELIIVSYGVVTLRNRVSLPKVIAPSMTMFIATAAAAALGIALHGSPAIGAPLAIAVFAALVVFLGAWPDDLLPARLRRS